MEIEWTIKNIDIPGTKVSAEIRNIKNRSEIKNERKKPFG